MEQLRATINALATETRPESIDPDRIASILSDMTDRIEQAAGSGGDVPADLLQRLDAIGASSATALQTSTDALNASAQAAASASAAKYAADGAQIKADRNAEQMEAMRLNIAAVSAAADDAAVDAAAAQAAAYAAGVKADEAKRLADSLQDMVSGDGIPVPMTDAEVDQALADAGI